MVYPTNQSDVVMATTRNYDASSMKTMDGCDNSDVVPWPDLNHDVLLLVMMQLGVIDFVSFNGVCKSWRSFSLSKRKMFMASRPPMSIAICTDANKKDYLCYLMDSDGRKFSTILPHSSVRNFVGKTCGYFIFFGSETKDFCLVNPITRHQLHFPRVPVYVDLYIHSRISAILVFSRLISGWLLVLRDGLSHKIWFSAAGKGAWNYVSSTFPVLDILAFKGKIYTISNNYHNRVHGGQISEMRFDSESKILTLFKTMNFPKTNVLLGFASCGENLYVIQRASSDSDLYEIHEIEFGEMKWVGRGKRKIYELGLMNFSAEVGRWPKNPEGGINTTYIRYFPNKCLNVDLID